MLLLKPIIPFKEPNVPSMCQSKEAQKKENAIKRAYMPSKEMYMPSKEPNTPI